MRFQPSLNEPDEQELRDIAMHPVNRQLAREFAACWRRQFGCEPFPSATGQRSWPVCPDPDPDKIDRK